MTSNSGERQSAEDVKGEQLIQIARDTVDSLEAIVDRLEGFIRSAEEARK